MEIREPRTPEEFEQYYELRWRVLREPWTSDKASARDEREKDAIHVIALDEGIVLGAGRVHLNSPDEAQVRYMAVKEGSTRLGIGGKILSALEERSREKHARWVVLSAREGARRFYEKHGYQYTGESSEYFGITHWQMRKPI
jgi:ribosomal protein S18 acetylase RimI-like enzyme